MNASNLSSLNYLDKIPEKIYQRLITHQYRFSHTNGNKNSLPLRTRGILDIRHQLLNGEEVECNSLSKWLDDSLIVVFRDKLNSKSLLDKTRGNESYTDDVLLQVLNWLDNITDDIESGVETDAFVDNDVSNEKNLSEMFDDKKADDFERVMNEVNDSFHLERSLGWDLTAGVKSKIDLNRLIESHNLIKGSKQLQSIVRMIGRDKSDRLDRKQSDGFNNISVKGESFNTDIPDDNSMNSVTGVCLGDDVSRMLSSELILLSRKKLKILWHARRAERQLLNYHFQGLMSEHVPEVETESLDFKKQANIANKNRGPIIICADTSASMKGRPELISKAIAYEVMRVAHLENRNCYLYCFSGNDELIGLELNLNYGWQPILEFLSLSFHGGTDINNLMLNVFNKINEHHWKNADVILLSDGRFKSNNNLIDGALKSNAFRIFGVQLGKWNTRSLSAICHIIFNLSDV